MGVKGMIAMAPGSIENVIPAVEEAKKAGINVIGFRRVIWKPSM